MQQVFRERSKPSSEICRHPDFILRPKQINRDSCAAAKCESKAMGTAIPDSERRFTHKECFKSDDRTTPRDIDDRVDSDLMSPQPKALEQLKN